MRFPLPRALWQLYPPSLVVVAATPAMCLQTLATAARPSTERLHLRNVFADGRRYYLQPRQAGFRLTSDTMVRRGGRRRRTSVAATLTGVFSAPADNTGQPITVIRLSGRISVIYLLYALPLPAFISSIIIYTPWSPALIVLLTVALFGLSLAAHRFHAASEVNEMVYFVQKALEDLPPADVRELQAAGPDVVMNGDDHGFRDQWRKFYEQQMRDTD